MTRVRIRLTPHRGWRRAWPVIGAALGLSNVVLGACTFEGVVESDVPWPVSVGVGVLGLASTALDVWARGGS